MRNKDWNFQFNLKFFKEYWLTIFPPVVFIVLYYFPFIYFGESSPVLIHDNLDANFVWVKILLDENAFWSSADYQINQLLNGIYRFNLYGVYDLSLCLFQLFGNYHGYIICKIFMAIVAYVGMFKLLSNQIENSDTKRVLIISSALLYALLPFWSFTFSVAALPLIVYVFLRLRIGNKAPWLYFVLIFYAFLSFLPLIGIFVLFIFFALWLYELIIFHRNAKELLIGLIVLSSFYMISHLPMIMGTFSIKDFVSQRVEMEYVKLNGYDALKKFDHLFRFGQYHAHSLHTPLILPIALAFVIRIFQKRWKLFALIFSFIAVSSAFYASLSYGIVREMYLQYFSILPIQLQRFHFFHPMLWYILLALSLETFSSINKAGKLFACVVVIYQAIYIIGLSPFAISERAHSLRFFTKANAIVNSFNSWSQDIFFKKDFASDSYLSIIKRNNLLAHNSTLEIEAPLFKEFFDVKLFDLVKERIDRDLSLFRVISVGLHPSIAQYNGFYTLDAYLPNYHLKYKHEFKQVIENEIKEDSLLLFYFNKFGARCYAFSKELRFGFLNPNPKPIKEPNFNYKKLKNMGCDYVISSSKIIDSTLQDLQFIEEFNHEGSFWTIRLYQINE